MLQVYEGMDPCLLPGFRRNYPTHSVVVMLRADMQRKTLQEMLLAAQRAKDDYKNVQHTAREAVGLGGQSFFSGSNARGVSTFPSQSETTLARYSQSGGNRGGGGWGVRNTQLVASVEVGRTPGQSTLRAKM